MTDQAASVRSGEGPLHRRVRDGLTQRHNWWQLARFAGVGASGYVINLAVYAALVHGAGTGYILAATVAWLVAVVNNFWWNRHWTFRARDGRARFQAPRFLIVSLIAFGVSLVILHLLVSAGVAKVIAQAIAVAAVTPLNFVGNKLWSFQAP